MAEGKRQGSLKEAILCASKDVPKERTVGHLIEQAKGKPNLLKALRPSRDDDAIAILGGGGNPLARISESLAEIYRPLSIPHPGTQEAVARLQCALSPDVNRVNRQLREALSFDHSNLLKQFQGATRQILDMGPMLEGMQAAARSVAFVANDLQAAARSVALMANDWQTAAPVMRQWQGVLKQWEELWRYYPRDITLGAARYVGNPRSLDYAGRLWDVQTGAGEHPPGDWSLKSVEDGPADVQVPRLEESGNESRRRLTNMHKDLVGMVRQGRNPLLDHRLHDQFGAFLTPASGMNPDGYHALAVRLSAFERPWWRRGGDGQWCGWLLAPSPQAAQLIADLLGLPAWHGLRWSVQVKCTVGEWQNVLAWPYESAAMVRRTGPASGNVPSYPPRVANEGRSFWAHIPVIMMPPPIATTQNKQTMRMRMRNYRLLWTMELLQTLGARSQSRMLKMMDEVAVGAGSQTQISDAAWRQVVGRHRQRGDQMLPPYSQQKTILHDGA